MDLIAILEARIASLSVGDYTPSLRAVLQHVRVAVNHLTRGAQTGDDTAFTDAIYRTNQAFEGSLKEAYRVLADKDPAKVRPFDIEASFQDQAALRPRVLAQLTRYRTEWRNPSTHDYRLDFDEDEALLAIVSVCAFAIVLVDQMIDKFTYERARAAAVPAAPSSGERPLIDQVADALLRFEFDRTRRISDAPPRETEIVAALSGYLASAIPAIRIEQEMSLKGQFMRPDLVVASRDAMVMIEIKRALPRNARSVVEIAVSQMSAYMNAAGKGESLLYMFPTEDGGAVERSDHVLPENQGRLVVVAPPEFIAHFKQVLSDGKKEAAG